MSDSGQTGQVNSRKITAFERLSREGRIDLTSGAWDHPFNVREAHCGRCGVTVPMGDGVPFNTFMRDHYRATTGYLCTVCGPLAATTSRGDAQ